MFQDVLTIIYSYFSECQVSSADAKFLHMEAEKYKINIESIDPSKDISMREVYGIDQNMIQ